MLQMCIESPGDFFTLYFLFKLLATTYELSKHFNQKQITGIPAMGEVLLLEGTCPTVLLSSSQW